jgi:hypothetical protein
VLWGRREESGVEEERTRERKSSLPVWWSWRLTGVLLSLSSGGNGRKNRRR